MVLGWPAGPVSYCSCSIQKLLEKQVYGLLVVLQHVEWQTVVQQHHLLHRMVLGWPARLVSCCSYSTCLQLPHRSCRHQDDQVLPVWKDRVQHCYWTEIGFLARPAYYHLYSVYLLLVGLPVLQWADLRHLHCSLHVQHP